MTRKEKIIEILENYVDFSQYERGETNKQLYIAIADEILAIPIDVPGDKEIEGEAMTYSSYPAMPDGHPEFDMQVANYFDAGVRWAIKRIKELNK